MKLLKQTNNRSHLHHYLQLKKLSSLIEIRKKTAQPTHQTSSAILIKINPSSQDKSIFTKWNDILASDSSKALINDIYQMNLSHSVNKVPGFIIKSLNQASVRLKLLLNIAGILSFHFHSVYLQQLAWKRENNSKISIEN